MIKEKLAEVGKWGAWDYIDVEHLYEEFEGSDLDRQRELVRGAFEYIGLKPRGRGSRRNVPLNSELLDTRPRRV